MEIYFVCSYNAYGDQICGNYVKGLDKAIKEYFRQIDMYDTPSCADKYLRTEYNPAKWIDGMLVVNYDSPFGFNRN